MFRTEDIQSHHHHHHHLSVMELGHLLTRSGLTFPEVSSKVCHDSFCQLGNSVSLLWVIYYGAFYLYVVSSFSYIPVICLKLVLHPEYQSIAYISYFERRIRDFSVQQKFSEVPISSQIISYLWVRNYDNRKEFVKKKNILGAFTLRTTLKRIIT
jgi:hypothetical protein